MELCSITRNDDEQSAMVGDCDSCSHPSADFPARQHAQPREWFVPSLTTLKDVVLIAFAILGFINLVRPSRTIHTHVYSGGGTAADKTHAEPAITSCDCGKSSAEALSLGCKYDSLAAAWLPAHCRDDELTAEFERSGPGVDGSWTYWTDGNHTREISIEEIAKGADDPEFRFHMTGHWHVIHCIFYWRKEHRARLQGKVVEGRSFSEAHSKHCGRIFLDSGRDTIAGVAFNTDAE